MIAYLNYIKARNISAIVDREYMLERYTNPLNPAKIINGMPLTVNVEGSYVKVNDIMELVVNRQALREISKWIEELKNPCGVGKPVTFRWAR